MHACCVSVCVSVCLLLRNHLLYYLLASSYSSIFPPIPPPPLPISPPVLFLKLPACLSSSVLRDLTLLLLHLTRKSKLAFLSAYPVRFRKLAGPFRTGPGCCTVGQCCKKYSQHQDDRCRCKFSCARLKRSKIKDKNESQVVDEIFKYILFKENCSEWGKGRALILIIVGRAGRGRNKRRRRRPRRTRTKGGRFCLLVVVSCCVFFCVCSVIYCGNFS